jgi:hypothetical protein
MSRWPHDAPPVHEHDSQNEEGPVDHEFKLDGGATATEDPHAVTILRVCVSDAT